MGGIGFAAAWFPMLVRRREVWGLEGLFLVGAFLSTMFVGSIVDRWARGGPLPALAGGAAAAWMVFSLLAPHYVDYKPPPQPVNLFSQVSYGGCDVILLDVRRDGVVRPGETFHLVAHWQPLRPVDPRWTVFVQVLDAQDRIWGQQDVPLALGRVAASIPVGDVITGTYTLSVAPQAPTDVRVIMGLYDRTTMRRFSTLEGSDHVTLP